MHDFHRLLRSCAHGLLAALTFAPLVPAADDQPLPLHGRIDRVIESTQVGPPAALSSDAEFLQTRLARPHRHAAGVDELKSFPR